MLGFWLYMLAVDLLIPATMIGFGLLFLKRPPKKINAIFGYRSMRSMQNEDTWRFAHAHLSKLWVRLGLALAVVMDESDLVRKMIYPIVVVSQTIPTTAIAPLFVLWFGYGIWSKVLVTVLITFFPITITVYDGLRSAKTEMAELLETYGATKKDIFLKIKVPCALPYFFSAVKMAVPMSIIGAAIGEWLGAKSGLGYFSRRMMTQLDGAGVFAPIVLLSAAAILAVAVVNLLEKRFVRWRGES